MKKILLSLILILPIFAISTKEINAYEYPSESYYFKIIDKNLSEITIFIPKNQIQNFSLQDNLQIINIGSSNITGYIDSYEYTVTFQPYQYGRYRKGNSYDYTYLDIRQIVDTNIRFSNESDILINTYGDYLLITSILIIGGFVILLWLKH